MHGDKKENWKFQGITAPYLSGRKPSGGRAESPDYLKLRQRLSHETQILSCALKGQLNRPTNNSHRIQYHIPRITESILPYR